MQQRMFHGTIHAIPLADQIAARFQDRQDRVMIERHAGSALIQIGSKHGTPVTVNISDSEGGVLVTMSRSKDWLDRMGDAGEMIDRATSGSFLSMLAMIPDVIGELREENIVPQIWDAINDICALSRALAGENDAPRNPIICHYCQLPNAAGSAECISCGAPLPVDLPRVCPKCARAHSSDALFCQACGTRLIEG